MRLDESQELEGPDVVIGSSETAEVAAARHPDSEGHNERSEHAGLPTLQDFAESRLVQSGHGEMMRLGKLSCRNVRKWQKSFAQGELRQVAACSDMLPEIDSRSEN